MSRRRSKPFTPRRESASVLDARTVGRDAVLRFLADKLASAATTGNRPHTLLVGPRGAGKTHLLEVALHRAQRDVPQFTDRVAVVRLDEDLVGVPRLVDLQREVLRALGAPRPPEGSYLSDAIADALGDRVLLLVIENLDRLFSSLREGGQQNLRGWVETSRQVVLLASAPLLFPGVSDRQLPWWGSFSVVHLDELALDDGRALLVYRAIEDGNDELVDFLRSDRGLARLRAIDALTGGSPRIWMILADIITVDLLDELTPAVEALFEGLVPYYQQLLWDLSPTEQLAVRALAEGSRQAMSVGELASATDIEPRTLATTLGRLVDSRWLRAEKPDGLDRRLTFYRLREPMLRHHLHYRALADQPLPLVVDLLRAWFDRAERRDHLLAAPATSEQERTLAMSISAEPHRFDAAYNYRNVDHLLAEARTWIAGGDAHSRTPEAGALTEYCITLARDGLDAAHTLAVARGLDDTTLPAVLSTVIEDDAETVDKIEMLLLTIASSASPTSRAVLTLIATCWNGGTDPSAARERLSTLAVSPAVTELPGLLFDVREELAFWTGEAGDPVAARTAFEKLLTDRIDSSGPNHLDSLTTRSGLAYWTGEAGDHSTARDIYANLLSEHMRILGPDHPETLTTRHQLAYTTSEAGDPATARDLNTHLLADRIRVLGPDHPDTLTTRHQLAYTTGDAGDPATARDLFDELLADRTRILGPDHPNTLITRSGLADTTSEAGDHATARDLYADLVADRIRILGPDHPKTLTTRHHLAHTTRRAGDPATARDLYADLLADHVRVLGPDHPKTLTTRSLFAYTISEAGDPATARDLFAKLLEDRSRILGVAHPDTLASRCNLAHWTGLTGDPDAAYVGYLAVADLAGESAIRGTAELDAAYWGARCGHAARSTQRLLGLAESVLPSLQRSRALGDSMVQFTRNVANGMTEAVDTSGPGAPLLQTLRLAVSGDADAYAGLPGELLEIVDEVRKNASLGSGHRR